MHDLVSKLPDDRAINAIVMELKKRTQYEVQQFILEMLQDDSKDVRFSALRIAQKMIQDKNVWLRILDIGLERKDVSEIKLWLTATANILGYKRLIKRLVIVADEHPLQVIFAWYQLVPLIRERAPDNSSILSGICLMIDDKINTMPDELKDYWSRTKLAVPLEKYN